MFCHVCDLIGYYCEVGAIIFYIIVTGFVPMSLISWNYLRIWTFQELLL